MIQLTARPVTGSFFCEKARIFGKIMCGILCAISK